MGKKLSELKRFSSKVGTLLLAGCVAAAFTPGLAFAHYEYNNKVGETKALIGESDPLNGDVTLVKRNGNTVQYMGYAHSDNGNHYTGYSLYTEITTDDEGIITGIDITSGNDTFAGMWGYAFATHGAKIIEGYLPEGVDFNAIKSGDNVWTPNLSGAEKYGYSLSSVTFISTDKTGEKDATGEGEYTEEVGSASSTLGTWADNKITVVDSKVNLVKVNYIIGSEKITFNTYFSVGEYANLADEYIDECVPPTEWGKGVNATNRGRWTHIMGSVVLRQLGSWGAAMSDSSLSTDLDGEVGAIDTVSGATKTAVPFVGALNQAREDGYVKGVSENVKVTIDGKNSADDEILPPIDVSANPKDMTTVVKNDDGSYTANVWFPYNTSPKRNESHGTTLDKVSVYALGDQEIGTQGMMVLAKQNSGAEAAFEAVKEYTPASEKLNPTERTGRNGQVTTSYSWAPTDTAEGEYVTAVDDDNVTIDYEVSDQPIKITTKNRAITHIVCNYTLGHGTIAIAYDLESMTKVPAVSELMAAADASDEASVTAARAAFNALPYDVRPFTTGIDNLHQAEAELVSAQLEKVDASDEAAVEAARAAYNKLDANAKAQVAAAAVQKLTAAEMAIADAKEAAEKAAADKAAADKAAADKAAADKAAADKAAADKAAADKAAAEEAALAKASNINTKKVSAKQIKKAASLGATTVTLGSKVKTIAKNAFKGTKIKTVVVKSKKLTKKGVKNSLKGSKVKTVKVNIGSKKVNKRYVKKYKPFFTKANCGLKGVKVK